jgi:hypothetical protein
MQEKMYNLINVAVNNEVVVYYNKKINKNKSGRNTIIIS